MTTTMTETTIHDLPYELIEIILEWAGPLYHAATVCRSWRRTLCYFVASGRCRRPTPTAYMAMLANHGAKDVIVWARGRGHAWDAQATAAAAGGGHHDLVVWLVDQGCPVDDRACTAAARGGHADILEWLLARGHKAHSSSAASAVAGGHREIIIMLDNHKVQRGTNACAEAARVGNMDMLRWLHDERRFPVDMWVRAWAMARGDDAMDAWARERRCADPSTHVSRLWQEAIDRGYTEIIRWLRAAGHPWPKGAFRRSALGGYRDVLAMTTADERRRNHAPCKAAAEVGDVALVKWLHADGWAWTSSVTHDFARLGLFLALQWAIDAGCQYDVNTLNHTIRHGHLPTMEWLDTLGRARGLEWHQTTAPCAAAISNNRTAALLWLLDHGYDCPARAMQWAVRKRAWDMFLHLADRGHECPSHEIALVIEFGPAEAVSRVLAQGYEPTETDALKVARTGRLDVFALLIDAGCSWRPSRCITEAQSHGHYAMANWMLTRCDIAFDAGPF
jgi:hypothetical protein